MGGLGSGERLRWKSSKSTVESCRSIDAGRWAREGIVQPGESQAGRWVWYADARRKRETAAIGYNAVASQDGTGFVRLEYSVGKGEGREHLGYQIALCSTRPNFGGLRWWFTCPLVVNGRPCLRRVRKLYLASRYFGCRHCHDLTYRSSQEAHKDERLDRSMRKFVATHSSVNPDVLRTVEQLIKSQENDFSEDLFD